MNYIVTDHAPGPLKPETRGQKLVRRVLSAVLPHANPDFEELFDEVRTWWVEVDEVSGLPLREIGFNASRDPILAAPFRDNLGFWIDSDMTFDSTDHENVKGADFEKLWHQFEQTWFSRERESAA